MEADPYKDLTPARAVEAALLQMKEAANTDEEQAFVARFLGLVSESGKAIKLEREVELEFTPPPPVIEELELEDWEQEALIKKFDKSLTTQEEESSNPEPAPLRRPRSAPPSVSQDTESCDPRPGPSGEPTPGPRVEEDEEEEGAMGPVPRTEAWNKVQASLQEARQRSREAEKFESEAILRFEEFVASYGIGDDLGNWPKMVANRKQEVAALHGARRNRKLQEEREKAARIAREQRAARQEEEARAQLAKAKLAASEAQARLDYLKTQKQFEESRREKEKAYKEARAANPPPIRCYVCGEPGIKNSKKCPKRNIHYRFLHQ